MLAQPSQSLTDLVLGLVLVTFAIRLGRTADADPHWSTSFWWAGIGALCGTVHHAVFVRWPTAQLVSWTIISVMVVLAVSYLLAATVRETLGPAHIRTFWALRSIGLAAYLVLALLGRAGVTSMLVCESVTMLSVLVLWGLAAYRRNPLAWPVLSALVASILAALTQTIPPSVTGQNPTATYHLAQIVGMAMLYVAVSRPRQPVVRPAV